MTEDRNGFLCIDWVWDNSTDDGFEPVGALNYWQTHAIVEALKPYATRCKSKLQYYIAKGEQNRGTEVLNDAADCADYALNIFTESLSLMRDRYKETETNETNKTTESTRSCT